MAVATVIAVATIATTVVVAKVASTIVVAEGGKQHMLCGAMQGRVFWSYD